MITVACVWVAGNVDYPAAYVTNLARMVSRHLTEDWRFCVLTDRPGEVEPPAGEALAIIKIPPPPPGLAGWWSKLELFNPAHADQLGERVLYLDLDVLIVGDLAPIAWYARRATAPGSLATLALVPPGGNFRPVGYRTVRRFNSSVMSFTPGAGLARLYSYAGARVREGVGETAGRLLPLWGDQDWIGEQMPDAPTMPAEWFPRLSELGTLPVSAMKLHSKFREARVILCKKPKPHVAAKLYQVVAEIWES